MATTTASNRIVRDERILRLHAHGHSEREIARLVGVSRTTVWNVIQAAKKSAG